MEKTVTITQQGQLTIPKSLRAAFGITTSTKAIIRKQGNNIIVEPKKNFWDLAGTLKSPISLSDATLRKARSAFSKNWAKP